MQKMTEFLVADTFPVTAMIGIGCHNEDVAEMARHIVLKYLMQTPVKVIPNWYY